MIVVTGATGQLGRLIVEQLLKRVSASEVAVSVRDPGKADALAAKGVRVRRGDFADAATLRSAFEGARQVLMVSSNAAAYGGDTLAQHRIAIDAARAAGVKRVVYTSQMASSPTSLFPPALSHATTEVMLRDSGLKWTSLRNGFYAQSALMMLDGAAKTGVLQTTEAGPVAWTTHADLAEAAAVILTNEGRFDGPTPPLTADARLEFSELCALASEVRGTPVRHDVVSEATLTERFAALGMPAMAVERSLGLFRAARAGEFAMVDPTLGQLLGRAPTSMREAMAVK